MLRNVLVLASMIGVTVTACVDPESCDDGHCHDDDGALFEQAYEEGQQEGKADGSDCSGVRVPDRSGFNKRIALTFDDGPNPATTPQVMATLRRHNAPATFFTNGSRYRTAGAKEIAAQIAADPLFILANHSYGHLNLSQQTESSVASEIDRTDALIRAAGETPRYFRFPFGAATCASKQLAQARGHIVTGWHVDSADWCYAAGGGYCRASTFRYVPDDMRGDMAAYVMQQVRATNGGIVLFHDIHASTANALDDILTRLAAEGYTFVHLSDTAAFPRLHGQAPTPPAPAKFIGDACTSDAGCAFMANGQAGRCHAAGFCTIACAGGCPDLTGKAPTFCIADATTANAGICVSKASTLNDQCARLPGTQHVLADRFIGASDASPATANVCAPR